MNTQLSKHMLVETKKDTKRKRWHFKKITAYFIIIVSLILLLLDKTNELGFASSIDTTNEETSSVPKNATPIKKAGNTVTEDENNIISSDDSFYYSSIAMPKEHQKYLYEKSIELNLDYKKLLAVIKTESDFDSNVISNTNDYGYFQINVINHERLANTLKSPNEPLNPEINIDWGTYMLADLYDYWTKQGIKGRFLDHHVWSSYNKGITGFKKYGAAKYYISKIEKNLANLSI